MIKIQKFRYFLINSATKALELTTWGLCGTGGIAMDDSRGVAIGEMATHPVTGEALNKWIPLSVLEPAFDPNLAIEYEYQAQKMLDTEEQSPTFGQVITKQVPVRTISSNMDFYNQPLKAGYVEITESQFNDPGYP